ncbi:MULTISPECIES: hypothetical protein [unclassified Saccharibacter]|uniref:hypothetical protein n=1 Tax=unclassified Saccharibacter TaxID=2648722 RepID=UPI001322A42A|nr:MULTISPECIES: hypothetical protein [unclassified Saccharibacter]MXV36343.1 hypothetical protein [Saccharibacter sp. EH611]MXV58444.1 hypothetical protein [Saccharibacter sp. EH70]MXV65927.1 hypothetical protein [Saccharibacter sp. EH60]
MKQTDSSPLFPTPFGAQADSGTLTQIPPSKTAIGRASLALGFPKETFTPIAAGGVPPYGEDMNGILNMLSQAVRASEAGLVRPFSASYAQQIGGYPRGSLVSHPNDPTHLFVSIADNNGDDPTKGSSGSWSSLTNSIDTIGAALTAETQRAQAAEAALLPLSGGTMSGALFSGGTFSPSENVYATQPIGAALSGEQFYLQLVNDNNAGTTSGRIVLRDGGGNYHVILSSDNRGNITTERGTRFLEGNDDGNGHVVIGNIGSASGKTLATKDDIVAETQRAENAEAGLLPLSGGTMTGDLAVSSVASWANTLFGGKCVSVVAGKKSNSYLQTQIVDGKTIAIVGVQDEAGTWHNWGFNASDGTVTTPSGKTLATTDAVAAETQRAENVEATLLPLSGGTLTGDAILLGNMWQNNLYSRTIRLRADESGLEGTMQLLGTTSNPVLSLGVTDHNKNRQSWWLNGANGAIGTPSGNTLPEVRGVPGRVVTQYFRITNLANVNYIPFPVAFAASDPVNEIFITYGYGYNSNGGMGESSVLYIYKQKTTNNGFWIDRSESGFQDAAFDVAVTGPMGASS